MLTIPVLEGRLVRLEPLSVGHVEGLVSAAGTDRSTFCYTRVPDGTADAEQYVSAALSDHAAGRTVPFAVRHRATGTVLGSTRFLDLEVFVPPGTGGYGRTGPAPDDGRPPTVAEIGGTWYSPAWQGSGINAEAKLLLLRHAFERWKVLRVCLKTDARNERSRRAIAAIGARFEGVRRAHMVAAGGGVRDSAYFSVLASEWPDVEARLEARAAAATARAVTAAASQEAPA